MATRHCFGVLAALLATTAGLNAATVKTTNFIVETARQEISFFFAQADVCPRTR